jgi:hypothetical protein
MIGPRSRLEGFGPKVLAASSESRHTRLILPSSPSLCNQQNFLLNSATSVTTALRVGHGTFLLELEASAKAYRPTSARSPSVLFPIRLDSVCLSSALAVALALAL